MVPMILIKAGQIGRTLPKSTTTRSPLAHLHLDKALVHHDTDEALDHSNRSVLDPAESQRITETKNRYPLEVPIEAI